MFQACQLLAIPPWETHHPQHGVQVDVLDLESCRSNEPKDKTGLEQYNLYKEPVFEATALYDAFKYTVWMENIPLERLCLTHLGFKDLRKRGTVIGRGYQSIYSVPHPGASKSPLSQRTRRLYTERLFDGGRRSCKPFSEEVSLMVVVLYSYKSAASCLLELSDTTLIHYLILCAADSPCDSHADILRTPFGDWRGREDERHCWS